MSERQPVLPASLQLSRVDQGVVRVLIVDEHPGVREGTAAVLESDPDLLVVGQAEGSDQAVLLAESVQVDVVVLALHLQGVQRVDLCPAEEVGIHHEGASDDAGTRRCANFRALGGWSHGNPDAGSQPLPTP
jgi:hypothetical protein